MTAGGPLPAVLPVVLYNGAQPRRVAQQMGDLIAAAGPALACCRPSQHYFVVDERQLAKDDLPQVFVDWIGRFVLRLAPAGAGALWVGRSRSRR